MIPRVLLPGLIIIAFAPPSPAGAAPAEVQLLSEARPAAARYTLADIASITSAEPAVQRRLASLVMGSAPRDGYTESISRDTVAARVRRIDPVLAREIRWSGARAVSVRLAGEQVPGERLTAVAQEALTRAWSGRRVEIVPASPLASVHVPSGSLEIVPRVQAMAGAAKRSCVWLDLIVSGQFYRSVPVWFSVRSEETAWVARRDLAPGETPREEDLVRQPVDAAAFTAPVSRATLDELRQTRVTRKVAAGRPLLAPDTATRPAVSRDERVTVRVASGPIVIETAGVALGDGRVGDIVQVRNQSTQETFEATVVAKGEVLAGRGEVTP